MDMPVSFKRTLALTLPLLLLLGGMGCRHTQPTVPVSTDPVVATYGNTRLTLNQFETQYARSVGGRAAASDDSLHLFQDFLERYVDFQVKVLEAKALGLEQDPGLQAEIQNYRTQLARPYLVEQEVIEPLLRDLYAKKQELIDASHILLRLAPDAPPADTLAAWNRIKAIRDSLAQGVSFGDLALRNSEDPSAKDPRQGIGYRGRLGYFTGGRMVKSFEDMAYNTPVGQVSPIFRTQFGYHLLQVHERRPMVPDIKISHLMVTPRGTTPEDTAAALVRLDSIRTRLANGEKFADLARILSDDRGSARQGGDIGWVSYDARLIQPMKDAAFALANVGDISEPVLTQFGYHLIQLTERRTPGTFEESRESLKREMQRMPRISEEEEVYAMSIRTRRGSQIDSALTRATFAGMTTDSLLGVLKDGSFPEAAKARTFASIADSSYTLGDLSAFVGRATLKRRSPDADEQLFMIVHQFMNEKALDYEVYALEGRDPEFKMTMDEFRNGLLLFRLMEDSVWTVASRDTAALEAHFQANAAQYRFPDRMRIIGFHTRQDSLLKAVVKDRLAAGTPLAQVIAELPAEARIQVDTTLVSGPTNSVYDQALNLAEGGHTNPVQYNNGYVVLVRSGMEPARAKTFEEARAEVVNAYQTLLEQQLVARLRRKYQATTYPDQVTGAFRTPATSTTTAAGQ